MSIHSRLAISMLKALKDQFKSGVENLTENRVEISNGGRYEEDISTISTK